jgi:hypothetical protein
MYSLTLAWLLSRLSRGRRLGWWLGTGFAVAGLLDVGAVTFAAANGTFSHFNRGADPIASMVVALWLSGSSGSASRTVHDAYGHPVTLAGSHGIADPDGHAMAVTHWSTTGGDLRVPHFTGLHAIQVLLLVTAVLHVLARRHRWLRDERVRARLVGTVALGYTALFAILSWQAWRGQPVAHPDRLTLTAFAAAGATTLAAATAIAVAARR